jgi:hypothetical protein
MSLLRAAMEYGFTCCPARRGAARLGSALRLRRGGTVMLQRLNLSASAVPEVSRTPTEIARASATSRLPDPAKAGIADKPFRLDRGRSVANDESVWIPGENVGRSVQFSSTCWLVKHGGDWLL